MGRVAAASAGADSNWSTCGWTVCMSRRVWRKTKAALLVVIGGLSDGRKVILAVEPGYRESERKLGRVYCETLKNVA